MISFLLRTAKLRMTQCAKERKRDFQVFKGQKTGFVIGVAKLRDCRHKARGRFLTDFLEIARKTDLDILDIVQSCPNCPTCAQGAIRNNP